MPFGNFYKESDQNAYRWRVIVGLTSLVVIVYFFAASLNYMRYLADQEKLGNESNRIQHINKICNNLPLPNSFRIVRRNLPISDDDSTLIVYYYQSKHSLEEMMPEYLDFLNRLNSDGWKSVANKHLVFEKNNQIISIFETKSDFANYEIRCSEEEISFGIYD
jgi:hypothetical protein